MGISDIYFRYLSMKPHWESRGVPPFRKGAEEAAFGAIRGRNFSALRGRQQLGRPIPRLWGRPRGRTRTRRPRSQAKLREGGGWSRNDRYSRKFSKDDNRRRGLFSSERQKHIFCWNTETSFCEKKITDSFCFCRIIRWSQISEIQLDPSVFWWRSRKLWQK